MNRAYNVEASVHKPINGGFRVKVGVKEIGLYINGMVVYPPNDRHEDWQVLTPSIKFGNKHTKIIEFNGKLPLWREICDMCIEAVKLYSSESPNTNGANNYQDVVLDDIDDGPADFSKVLF